MQSRYIEGIKRAVIEGMCVVNECVIPFPTATKHEVPICVK